MTLEPSIDMRVPRAWPLACARRVDFLFWSFNLTLKCEYVLEVQEKDLRTGDNIVALIPFESLSSSFSGPIPTKWSTRDPQAAKSSLFRFPRLAFEHSTFPALPFEFAVLRCFESAWI